MKNLKKFINEEVKRALREDYRITSPAASKDNEVLRAIYMKAVEIEDYAKRNSFENSPILDGTNIIMKYCLAQKQRLINSEREKNGMR